jgi:DNA-binding transcriptional regulator GbsR (MarR family)
MISDQIQAAFIQIWGEMAPHWGISRTMAQIYALLFSAAFPMDTDQIMSELGISRGNANMNLHRLMQWGLVLKQDRNESDSRKDLYYAEKDVWSLTAHIIHERNKLEISPLYDLISQLLTNLPENELTPETRQFYKQLQELLNFLDLFNRFTHLVLPLIEKKDFFQIQELIQFLELQQQSTIQTQTQFTITEENKPITTQN